MELSFDKEKALKKKLLKYETELRKRLYNSNPKKWINDLCYIRSEGGGKERFLLRDYQEEFIDIIMANKKTVALKARQMGFSWVNAALILYMALYHPYVDIMIMSKDEKAAIQQLDRVRFIYDNLLAKYRMKRIINNAQQLSFDNGTNVYSLTSGKDSGRGYTSFFTLWDEAAISEYDEDIRNSIEPATNKGTFVVQSTPKGMGNEFHKMWLSDDFAKFKCDWRRHPDRDEEWAKSEGWLSEEKHKAMRFAQEYDCDFLLSSMNVFPNEAILDYKELLEQPIETKFGGLKVYRERIPSEKYAIGVDVAEGLIRGDYSTIVVMAKSTNEVVAVYRERANFDRFTQAIIDTSRYYNKALVAVEKNNHGHVILENLKRTKVPLYHQKRYDNYYKKWTSSIGWQTNAKTKPIAVQELVDLVRNKDIGILDYNILDELSTYIYEERGASEKMNAMSGAHDDLVLATAICVQCLKDVRGGTSIVRKNNEHFVSYRNLPDNFFNKPEKKKNKPMFIKTAYY